MSTLPNILKNAKCLPKSRFHNEALASRYGISYADVFTQYGKLLEGVEVVGYYAESENAFAVMFHLPTGEEVFFHYTDMFFTDLQWLVSKGSDVNKIFVSRRRHQ